MSARAYHFLGGSRVAGRRETCAMGAMSGLSLCPRSAIMGLMKTRLSTADRFLQALQDTRYEGGHPPHPSFRELRLAALEQNDPAFDIAKIGSHVRTCTICQELISEFRERHMSVKMTLSNAWSMALARRTGLSARPVLRCFR